MKVSLTQMSPVAAMLALVLSGALVPAQDKPAPPIPLTHLFLSRVLSLAALSLPCTLPGRSLSPVNSPWPLSLPFSGQAPVVVHNLQRAMHGQELNGYYHGYGSCPLMVNSFRVILAEFGYDGVIMETFPYQMGAVQERVFAFVKREVFPFCYWHLMPRGMWYGKDTFFKPDVSKNPPAPGEPAPAC